MQNLKHETKQFVKYLGELSTYEILQCILSGIFGILICVFTSAIVNTTLVEISINIIFAFYFGVCFLMIGILLVMRIQSLPETSEMGKRKPFLFIFSCMVIVSGTFCFFLEDNWFIKLPPFEKGPIYTIISMSLNFCVIFSIVDLMNFFMGFCQKSHQKTMVETPKQIAVTLFLSVVMGLFYGIIFSIFDLEDQRGAKLDSQLIQDEYYCIPIASILGFVGGFINELLRIRGDYLPIIFTRQEDPFNEEI
ncbi:membrane protein, putative (macronuclear) [Tetrahymena thermophila SB210]|uniref:Membrane protein, putative n=1 Tax=Tetrahymena thermophila (strain SB210) TaxID=312017 RepID=Q23H92_TETTS|nr:membrane protein, putative [Tetrahymena thermophila SB210]EAR95916.2 membrane protein, putative [Tetrahymena thermophila SB210]|eukprot:XP_001016161.2 membrane protein, putative [Tetrahymena thermophila SB210]